VRPDRVSGVIFDLGSTLIHRTGLELEQEKCAALARFAACEWGVADPAGFAARLLALRLEGWRRSEETLVECPACEPIAQAFAGAGLALDQEALRRAEAAFFEPEVQASRLYPGAVEALERLRAMGLRVGMISNATSHRLILDITRRHGIEAYFDPLVTSAAFGHVKPHPGIFAHVLDAWRMPARHAVMVGDTLGADIAGACAVGMRSILVDIEPNPANPGFAGPGRPDATVTALGQVSDLIEEWRRSR
jgi:putative hydrolase of the HAD superfamily